MENRYNFKKCRVKKTANHPHLLANKFSILTKNVGAFIFIVQEGKFVYVNPAFEVITGYSAQELYQKHLWEIIEEDNRELVKQRVISREKGENVPVNYEFKLLNKKGEVRWIDYSSTVITYIGKPAILGSGIDITTSKNMEEMLHLEQEKLAYLEIHDTLTHLYNWNYFRKQLENTDKINENNSAIIVCDLDGLKLANDTLGYSAGDTLLRDVAKILRSSCPPRAIIARTNGSEFATLIRDIRQEKLRTIIENIYKQVSFYNKKNNTLSLSLSIGFAYKQNPNQSLTEVMQEANQLMYREKLLHKQSSRSGLVDIMMKALEVRDYITEGHTDRLQEIVEKIAKAINMPENRMNDLSLLALFHDIGKVGIADSILFKPDKLSDAEMEEMKKHSNIGYHIAKSTSELAHIADWILKHHEKWDGSGYPLGLKGEEIPIECRILTIADAYDAMSNDRPYRKAMTQEEIIEEFKNCSGKQFDPELLKVFFDKYLLI
ncbi:hypothetical protein SYNTR_1141 [Candidatus Syntrophocurvum alkaliphilum]|uniref:Uncharacterized protein n=1 Tax=Candidatus Syntrophocurvum alkaliphilum TaxID=2293317 RepID=A0A6I6DIQ1_9FIRM|nr:HD domain-containing phosphohydrolase [Candidatus Syntrophocurvum alkaliphilum]QGT99734.1 hypothetical protein SYNTR_1141 [Candidatus Syntrophocurvum alkaliphilum]